jgi:hypothetical protein
MDLTLFRFPRFVGVQFLAAAPAYAFVVLLVLLPIRFIGVEGMSEIKAGQLMICLSGPLLILPLLAGQAARWIAPATICGVGLLAAAAGLVWLSRVPEAAGALVAPLVLIGIGIALPWGLMDGLAVSVVPKERAGMAVGIFNTTRVASEGVALTVVMAVLSGSRPRSSAPKGWPHPPKRPRRHSCWQPAISAKRCNTCTWPTPVPSSRPTRRLSTGCLSCWPRSPC